VVVQDAEQHRLAPLAARQDDRALALVEIEVPQGVHVADLERPSLAWHEAWIELVAPWLTALVEPVVFHVAAHRRVARQLAKARRLARDDDQIVVDELEAPTRVVAAKLL
jgi:hypothetical protein